MTVLCTSPAEVAQLAQGLFLIAGIAAFVGAGGASLLRDAMREAFYIWRAHRRVLRLRRRAA